MRGEKATSWAARYPSRAHHRRPFGDRTRGFDRVRRGTSFNRRLLIRRDRHLARGERATARDRCTLEVAALHHAPARERVRRTSMVGANPIGRGKGAGGSPLLGAWRSRGAGLRARLRDELSKKPDRLRCSTCPLRTPSHGGTAELAPSPSRAAAWVDALGHRWSVPSNRAHRGQGDVCPKPARTAPPRPSRSITDLGPRSLRPQPGGPRARTDSGEDALEERTLACSSPSRKARRVCGPWEKELPLHPRRARGCLGSRSG